MPDMTYNTIAFYGDQQEIHELDEFLGSSKIDYYFNFSKIRPMPEDVYGKGVDAIYEWKFANWGTTWCSDVERSLNDSANLSTLKVSFNTPWVPPIKLIDYISGKCSKIKFIYRSTIDDEGYKTVFIRRDPKMGFNKCLIDYPYGCEDHPLYSEVSGVDVLGNFMDELNDDKQLRAASAMIGITVDRIRQRKDGTLQAI